MSRFELVPNGRTVLLYSLLVILLLSSPIVAPVASEHPDASSSSREQRFTIFLHADGDATITVTYLYDLTDAADRTAFETLADNESFRTETRDLFRERLRRVANASEETTGRSMRIDAATIELRTVRNGSVGVVNLSVRWSGLAATDDGTISVTEPFASGFEPDRDVVLRAPMGYTIQTVEPAPQRRTSTMVLWENGTSLSGFEAILTPRDTAGQTEVGDAHTATSTALSRGDGGMLPGVGFPGVTLALVIAVLTLYMHHNRE